VKALNNSVKYSICICNWNMGDTLERSLLSVIDQINENFEIVLIDDGSTDNSNVILDALAAKHENLSFYTFPRDSKRRLGATRNKSMELAKGEWCIFHIDMDDFIGPYLLDFCRAVELLDSYLIGEHLYSGKQIHMARRGFLLQNGPFKNIYRGEDRDLYERLAPENKWIILDHVRFVQRFPRDTKKLLRKKVHDVWDQTVTDLQFEHNPFRYFLDSARKIQELRSRRFLIRSLLIPPASLIARRRGLFKRENKFPLAEFVQYRTESTKTLSAWMDVLNIPTRMRKDIDETIFP
jgi:glycosyltransferase involved in cell wall biosynthesis